MTVRALVTNDDGVESHGLRLLAAAAAARGMDVTVVAPSYDASGTSASMTAVAAGGKVVVDKLDGPLPVLGVQGPPAFIVRAAIYGAFGPPPDLVLSGVNRGLNTGRAILHSGTVGAALTAANYGRRGLAVSAAVDDDAWEPAEPVIDSALSWLLGSPEGTVLNVNVPSAAAGPYRGVRATSLSDCGTVQGNVTETDGRFVPVTFDDDSGQAPPGSDTAALAEGYVSVTAVRAVVEDDRFDVAHLLLETDGDLTRA